MNKKTIINWCASANQFSLTIFTICLLCFLSLAFYLVGEHYPFEQWTDGEKNAFIVFFTLGALFFWFSLVLLIYSERKRNWVDKKLIELNEIIYPEGSKFNFPRLKAEVQKLQSKELEPQLKRNQNQLTKLITNLQNKVNDDAKAIMDLYLQAHAQMITQDKEDDTFAQAQLTNYENALQDHLTQKELQKLRIQQKETLGLEQRLNNLRDSRERKTDSELT
ncbi:hypothetical protein C1645_828629 [Glomus cerebriforme]|uniref:Uncharacterized protein n=1 Tax=Glomus cerebriforme TaxID=658196 RepID=A0A397SKX2_9GLOM|nr:hypothetical protein C1645_828629 [Glomus cerebriforme]